MPQRYIPNDKWSRKAKEDGYRARSVYKLMEIDQRERLLKPGMTVLDIGSAPGSWLQYVSEKIGPAGRAFGFDLTPVEPIAENVRTYVQDIGDVEAVEKILAAEGVQKVDVVLSDIAPSTTGIRDVDQWRSVELSQAVARLAERFLKRGGVCIMKVFRGADFETFVTDLKKTFRNLHQRHPVASRDRSREIYVVVTK